MAARDKQWIEHHLLAALNLLDAPLALKESMAYSLGAGGKRLRPTLLFAVLEALGQPKEKGLAAAMALEMIHTYSLIHDDLPAMDNDDLRRGKPTNHVVFGEAMAILAGDGLLTQAFSLIANDVSQTAELRLKLISQLSLAAGPSGMIAGQVLDMEAENNPVSLKALEAIHKNKTGRLIEFAVLAAALIGGAGSETLSALQEYAGHLGLAFQIKDDILDVEGSAQQLGKTPGKDAASAKTTYVSLLGLTGAKEKLASELEAAKNALGRTAGLKREQLLEFIELVGNRSH